MMDLMSIKPVFLLSDCLIFVLVACLLGFIWHLSRNPISRGRWRQVFASRIGSASFIVILFYVLIAFIDSIHFQRALPATDSSTDIQYSQEVESVLDVVLHGLHNQDEKTYSAPLSIYSFAKENTQTADGSIRREFPRLENAGSHLASADEHLLDIALKIIQPLLISLLVMGIIITLHQRVRKKLGAVSYLPWNTLYVTVTLLVCVSSVMLYLGQYYHVFGTDKVGQDVLYQSLKAVRTGVLIGTLATLITLPLAIVLGISAGYFKGWIDDVVQYIYTTLNSIPGILLIAASVLLIDVYIETHPDDFKLITERADFKFLALCAILGMTSWTGLCRLLRAETLKVSQLDYVQAAHAFGVSHSRVIGRHILPNVTHIILIALVLDFSGFVLAEAVLSYIGVGVDPSMASWGNMINEARAELAREPVVWWSVSSAFFFMFSLVLAANLFSDRVRDAFDPRTTPTVAAQTVTSTKDERAA